MNFLPISAWCRRLRAPGIALTLAAMTCGPATAATTGPPSWQVGYQGTGYRFATESRDGTTEDHFHHFHRLSGSASGLAGGWLTLRGASRFTSDHLFDLRPTETARLYHGYLEARLGRRMQAQLGRRYLQAGVTSLTLDGAVLQYAAGSRLDLTAYAGARSPVAHRYELGDFDLNTAAGGLLSFRPNRAWRLGASTAYHESGGRIANRLFGGEVVTSALPNVRLLGRLDYDTSVDHWSRIQLQGQWRRAAGTTINAQYVDRRPTIDAGSWFARFTDQQRIRVARVAVRHELPSRYGGEFEYMGSFVGERASARVGLAALLPGGRLGYSVRLGDAGEESRFYGEYEHRLNRWLWVGAEASLLTYTLMQDAPADQERDLTTLAARVRVALRPGLRVLAEVQSLDNPGYDKDVRFLLGLDLTMARGASRLGLDRGGWLQ